MAATRALMRADWRAAAETAQGLHVWRLLPEVQRERVLAVVRRSIQEESLRTFLFAAPSSYSSLSLDQLLQVWEVAEEVCGSQQQVLKGSLLRVPAAGLTCRLLEWRFQLGQRAPLPPLSLSMPRLASQPQLLGSFPTPGLVVALQMFDLPEKAVVNKISQMVMAEELEGSWDQPTRTVHLHALQPTRLQLLAMQVGDALCCLLPVNLNVIPCFLCLSMTDLSSSACC